MAWTFDAVAKLFLRLLRVRPYKRTNASANARKHRSASPVIHSYARGSYVSRSLRSLDPSMLASPRILALEASRRRYAAISVSTTLGLSQADYKYYAPPPRPASLHACTATTTAPPVPTSTIRYLSSWRCGCYAVISPRPLPESQTPPDFRQRASDVLRATQELWT
ncbi:hypothetical protein BDN71DRAFT_1509679 [Pleurotus eryngii]|uniref:Uncharacterized protein n=1 Tax=Pleurotus eryngii TaxID=5323 RepID=A0A9P5ZTT5_PLEER|nr:hypothetical protein BDN71DRAFT_1509679 [Pleurotus eryngii]